VVFVWLLYWVLVVGGILAGGVGLWCFWVGNGSILGVRKWVIFGGFGLGVGAFSENGGFLGFWGYKSSSVFGLGNAEIRAKLVGRGILGVGVI